MNRQYGSNHDLGTISGDALADHQRRQEGLLGAADHTNQQQQQQQPSNDTSQNNNNPPPSPTSDPSLLSAASGGGGHMIHLSMGNESTRLLLTKTSSLLSDEDEDERNNNNNNNLMHNLLRTNKTPPRQQQQQQQLHYRGTSTNTTHHFGARLLAWYQYQLDVNPVLTKSITSALLTGAGDLCGQAIEVGLYNKHRHDDDNGSSTTDADDTSQLVMDWYRTGCFTLMGLLLQGPLSHYYYDWLDRAFPPAPRQPLQHRITYIKLAIDQLAWAPFIALTIFVFLDPLQGRPLLPHLRAEYWGTLRANWKLWIPGSLVNLAFCPPAWRVFFCNIVFFVWSICLSILLNQ